MTKAFDNASMLASWLASSKTGGTIDSTAANTSALILKNTGHFGDVLAMTGTGTSPNKFVRVNSSVLEILNSAYATVVASLSDAGTLTAVTLTQTSDERKKSNWRALTDEQLDALANMEKAGVFDWLDGSGESVGGSAQEIERIVPQAVHTDEHGNKTVNYGGLGFAIQQATLRRLWGTK